MEQSLGKRIMSHRKRLGLTQDQLAEKLGVTAQAVSKWENDQSCPDITVIPRLAEIFSITTDELLGKEPVHRAEAEPSPLMKKPRIVWTGGRKAGVGASCLIILVGVLYLLSGILSLNVSFWNILWPSSLLIYGLFGLFPNFSYFRLGCSLLGGYYLFMQMFSLNGGLDRQIILAVLIVLIGVSLLLEALGKKKKAGFQYQDQNGNNVSVEGKNEYHHHEADFTYKGSFGSKQQFVSLQNLVSGQIDTSFGEYTVNLSGVNALAPNALIEASCSFGDLHILVPGRFSVIPDSSTAFAGFQVQGEPDDEPEGELRIRSKASFGQITVRYI